jgi:Flp pilus assembly protein TadD
VLETSITEVQQVQNSKSLAPFGVLAQLSNPLVDPGPVSIRKGPNAIEVGWTGESFPEPAGFAEQILKSVVEWAKKDTRRFPSSSRSHANLALALLKAGQVDDAILELGVALELDPVDYIAGLTLARLHINNGDIQAADSLFQRLLVNRPDDPNLLVGLARLLIQKNNHAGAEDLLKRAIAANEHLSSARFLLGVVRLRNGNVPGAINALKIASRTDVRNPALHHTLGVAYAMIEEFSRAERAFRTALSLAPHSASSLRALCMTLLDQERPEEALAIVKPHIESNPTDTDGRDLLWRAYFSLRKYSLARSQIRQIIYDLGDSISVRRKSRLVGDLAATFGAEGQWKEAEAGCWKAVEIDAIASSTPYANLARIYFSTNRVQAGLDVLENSKSLFPGSEILRILISSGYARLNRFQDALAEVSPLLESGNATSDTYAQLGWLHSWLGDFDKALSVAKAGNERYPRVPGLINNLAYVYLELGRVSEARAALESLRKSTDQHAELIATHGLLRLWEGDFNGARELYQRAAQKASESGNKELSRKVRQKLHLELAKAFVRQGNFDLAQVEIQRGLAVRVAALSYDDHLKQLARSLP